MRDRYERLSQLSPVKRALLYKLLQQRAANASESGVIRHRREKAAIPLSFAQERLWFLDQLHPGSCAYNLPIALRLQGSLNLAALDHSLNEILRRHEAMRTTFAALDGRPVQAIAPTLPLQLEVVDLAGLPESERQSQALQLATEEARRPFNLTQGPMLRATLFRLDQEEHLLLLATHHIVADGSIGLLLRELATFYKAFSTENPSPLPELPIQYGDYAQWQRQWFQGEIVQSQLSYWKQQLGGSPSSLHLATDRPRPVVQTHRGARLTLSLPETLSEALNALSRREGTTLFITLLAAYQVLLRRYTGQDDIVVGSPISERSRVETERLIGCFTNTLALRTDLSGNPSFRELLGRVREVALEAYAHKDLPFEMLVEALQPERDLSRTPLFQVMFTLQNVPTQSLQLPNLTVTHVDIDSATARFDLLLGFLEASDGLTGLLEYSTDLFEAGTISRMLGHFRTLLEGVVADPTQPLSKLPLLTPAERRQLLVHWNDTEAAAPGELLHTLFQAQMPSRRFQPAVISSDRTLTYEQLYRRSNQLGHKLRNLGAGPNVLVAVVMEKGWEQVVAVLGVLQAGAAYLPLDPKLPKERLWTCLEHGEVDLVLTQPWLNELLDWPETVHRLCVDGEELASVELVSAHERPTDPLQVPEDLAYVIFTSGSTGIPKGVMIDHRGAVNTILDINKRLSVGPEDRVLALSSLSFDLSVYDIFGMLAAGGTIVMPDAARLKDPAHWAELAVQAQVTVWNSVPALLQTLVGYLTDRPEVTPHFLRLALLSGDWIPVTLPGQLRALLDGVRVISLGGATEASIWSVFYPIEAVALDWKSLPYGRPLTNQHTYVLDETLEPCPVGVPGQLHIGGIGLAQGYWRDEEKTNASFFTHPQTRERLYRTGDLARYLSDGNIEFLGRLDHQMKIRGFRVEAGEVEAALRQHPAVEEAVVVATEEENASGQKRLVAYLLWGRKGPVTTGEVRAFVREKLPEYMVPSALIVLDALPLTPNGKVDRGALPDPGGVRPESQGASYVAPRDTVELQLAQIWEEILGVRPVGIRDDFFDLGGYSLLATQLVEEIRKAFEKDLPVATLFQGATVEQQASLLRQAPAAARWSHLVGIQPLGSKRPFFCVHPAGGSAFCYLELARCLGLDQPFYGLQARGLDGQRAPHTQIEAMATEYVDELRTLEPAGPYLLGGWSMGGLVALEMAQQLRARGQNVALLALLDTQLSVCDAELVEEDRAAILVNLLAREFPSLLGEAMPLSTDDLRHLEPDQQLTHVVQWAKMANVLLPDYGVPHVRILLDVFVSNLRAMGRYVPQAYSGRVAVFRAGEPPDKSQRGLKEPDLQLNELLRGEVEIQVVPGNHYTMLRKPDVEVLAGQLSVCLEDAGG